jgi:hypothetical protein
MIGHVSSEKNVRTHISTTRALVPIHAISARLPVPEHRTKEHLYYSERWVDGLIFVGRESERVKTLYCSSGRARKTARRIGNLLDIRV